MTQCTRWGVAALAALAIFAGCGGGDDSNPITDGQAVPARDPKFAPGLKIQGHPDNFPDHIGRARLSELRGRQGATNPFAPAPTLATPTGELTAPRAGFATGTLGTFRLEVDPDLTGRIVFPRTGQTQGDRYLLGIDQFFGPGKINVESITRGPDGTVDVTIAFTHPFPRPADLIGPPTATKRLDLHVFNVWAGILVQGTENYFSGTVTTNTRALRNPDTYRETGQLVNLPAGVTADAFPGKWVADQSAANTDPAQDNYDPADNGWVGAELQDPRGYGVFPQGATVPVTFQFDPEGNGGSISVDMAILADYQDPRATPAPKNNRLPDPLDPTKLRYILPFGAGDLQSIQTSITGDLPATGGTETVTVDIVDLDADAPVASGTWPNDANLNEMPFASDIQSVETSFNVTGVTASVPLPAAGSGDGTPGNPKKYEFTLTNDGTAAEGAFTGLVRVVDEETANLANEPYINLDPNLQPIGTPLPIQAYQAVNFNVGASTGGNAAIVLDEDLSYVLITSAGPPVVYDSWGAAPAPPQTPFTDPRATSVAVDDETGTPIVGYHGLGTYGADPLNWGSGFLAAFNDDPATPAPDDFAIRGIGTTNSPSAANKSEPRANRNRVWVVGDAYHNPLADGSVSVWSPYGANPTAKGYMGWTTLITQQQFPGFPAYEGRTVSWVIDDLDLWMKNGTQWTTDRGGFLTGFFMDITGVANEPPLRPQTGMAAQDKTVDLADSEFDRGAARDITENDLAMMTALNGTYNPNQLPTNAPYWQFWQLLDYDWTTTPSVVEDWADAGALNGFTANLPSKNSSVDPAAAGTGVGKIDANRTVGFDYSHSADRLYVADDQDDSVEVYETLLNGSTDPAVAQEWVYLGISTAAGVLVDPVDIAVTANDFVVVLDKGGASGNYRLVALSGTDLTVVATRDLIVEGDIPAGAISISNDESLVNVNDPSAFVLLWDAPELPTTAPKGGMNWYTIDTTP